MDSIARKRKEDAKKAERIEQQRQERFARQKAERLALATRIKGVREALRAKEPNHWSQQDVADLLGIERANYRRYESGGVAPLPKRLSELAEILGTTTAYLLGQTDRPERIEMTDLSEDEMEVIRAFRRRDLKTLNRLFHKKAREHEGE